MFSAALSELDSCSASSSDYQRHGTRYASTFTCYQQYINEMSMTWHQVCLRFYLLSLHVYRNKISTIYWWNINKMSTTFDIDTFHMLSEHTEPKLAYQLSRQRSTKLPLTYARCDVSVSKQILAWYRGCSVSLHCFLFSCSSKWSFYLVYTKLLCSVVSRFALPKASSCDFVTH